MIEQHYYKVEGPYFPKREDSHMGMWGVQVSLNAAMVRAAYSHRLKDEHVLRFRELINEELKRYIPHPSEPGLADFSMSSGRAPILFCGEGMSANNQARLLVHSLSVAGNACGVDLEHNAYVGSMEQKQEWQDVKYLPHNMDGPHQALAVIRAWQVWYTYALHLLQEEGALPEPEMGYLDENGELTTWGGGG